MFPQVSWMFGQSKDKKKKKEKNDENVEKSAKNAFRLSKSQDGDGRSKSKTKTPRNISHDNDRIRDSRDPRQRSSKDSKRRGERQERPHGEKSPYGQNFHYQYPGHRQDYRDHVSRATQNEKGDPKQQRQPNPEQSGRSSSRRRKSVHIIEFDEINQPDAGNAHGSSNNNKKTVEVQKATKQKQKRSKSLESLRSKIFSRTRSNESLSKIIDNYKKCCSLVELSQAGCQPPDGLLLDGNNNQASIAGSSAPPSRNNSTTRVSPSVSTSRSNSHSRHRRARTDTGTEQRNRVNAQFHQQQKDNTSADPQSIRRTRERVRHKRHSESSVPAVPKVEYADFKLDLEQYDEPKMLAKATRVLQEHVKDVTEHVKDVTEKTKTTCCVGKSIVIENTLINNDNNMRVNGTQQQQPQQRSDSHHHQQQHHQQQNHHHNQQYTIYDTATYVTDKTTGTTYIKGRLLGKGGFAKCYEMTDAKSRVTYAGKIVSKNRLSKPHQREKIAREIELHRKLRHRHVVGFHSYFEDSDNVYIILEICSRKSLVHVLKNRKTLTEPEVRYYMKQLVEGCKYIHKQKIVHRDLKLGNMLLNESMQLKVADFGLATRIEYTGEKKMTVCGTPNYIAPEVLQKNGHSYEADVWALGCVMYALLVGRPPFETSSLKETYARITANKYSVPSHISTPCRNLIQKLLSPDVTARPTLDKILFDDFFWSGYTPKVLPSSCCDIAPKFHPSHLHASVSRPKSYAAPVSPAEAMQKITNSLAQLKGTKRSTSQQILADHPDGHHPELPTSPQPMSPQPMSPSPPSPSPSPMQTMMTLSQTPPQPSVIKDSDTQRTENDFAPAKSVPSCKTTEAKSSVGSVIRLYQMLTTCLHQMPTDSCPSPVHANKPLWVTKWVDYSNKYGFGFQLSDKNVGVLFNDTTRMLLTSDGKTIQYNDLSNKVYTFMADSTPPEYERKATLLLYFAQYMDEHLIHGGDILKPEYVQPTAIFMKKWFRTSRAIVMYLNNGTLQVNFFEDHTKVILSPDGQDYLVTYINTNRQAVAHHLLQLRHFGCHPNIVDRLKYAREMLESIINIEGEAV